MGEWRKCRRARPAPRGARGEETSRGPTSSVRPGVPPGGGRGLHQDRMPRLSAGGRAGLASNSWRVDCCGACCGRRDGTYRKPWPAPVSWRCAGLPVATTATSRRCAPTGKRCVLPVLSGPQRPAPGLRCDAVQGDFTLRVATRAQPAADLRRTQEADNPIERLEVLRPELALAGEDRLRLTQCRHRRLVLAQCPALASNGLYSRQIATHRTTDDVIGAFGVQAGIENMRSQGLIAGVSTIFPRRAAASSPRSPFGAALVSSTLQSLLERVDGGSVVEADRRLGIDGLARLPQHSLGLCTAAGIQRA